MSAFEAKYDPIAQKINITTSRGAGPPKTVSVDVTQWMQIVCKVDRELNVYGWHSVQIWCMTCGKDIVDPRPAKLYCAGCEEWWEKNPPEAVK
jgi:hypothetical protein